MKTLLPRLSSIELLSSGLIISALCLHLLSLIFQPYLNHDVAEYITIGQMIVNGATPYSGIIDLNPPMIFYLSALPVLLSAILNISIPIISLFFFFSIMLLSGYLFIQALGIDSGKAMSRAERNLLWTFWILLSFFTYKTDHFAQREQLIFMFLAGFIALRKARYETKNIPFIHAVGSGFLAAMAFSMKPQFILAILVTELLFFISSRHRWNALLSPEIVTVISFGTVYIIHFFVVPGEANYFTYWIPVISKGYSAYSTDWKTMVAVLFADRLTFVNLFLIVIAAVLFVRKQYTSQTKLFFAFIGFGVASLIIYFAQSKGWLYQTLGFHYGSLTGFAFLVRENHDFSVKIRNTVLALLIVLNINASISTVLDKEMKLKAPFQFPENAIALLIKQFASVEQRVLFLSTTVGAAFPQMTYTEYMSGGRFATAFPIAFFTNHSRQGQVLPGWEKDEQFFFTWLLQDISEQKPVLVFVNLAEDGETYSYLSRRHFFDFLSDSYACIGESEQLIVYLRIDQKQDMTIPMREKISMLYQQKILHETSYCS